MISNVRAQYEAVNGHLKQFNVLTNHFRHLKPRKNGVGVKNEHKLCFHAVAVTRQMKSNLNGQKVFVILLNLNVLLTSRTQNA